MNYSDNVVVTIIVLGVCVVLPIVIVWLVMRAKKNETEKRTQIILSAIEKNPNVDTNQLVKMMTATSKKKSVKQKLLDSLHSGCIMVFIGLALLLQAILMSMDAEWKGVNFGSVTGGVICLGIGIAFLINYFYGKRFLAKEIEREENNLPKEK